MKINNQTMKIYFQALKIIFAHVLKHFPLKVSMFSLLYFFFKSFATHSTQGSMLSVSCLG